MRTIMLRRSIRLVDMQNAGVSLADYRGVWKTITGDRSRLQGLIARMSHLKPTPREDPSPEVAKYNTQLEDIYQEHLVSSLEYLKDAPPPASSRSSASGGATRSGGGGNIKRGSCTYQTLIEAYPENVRATMLFDHLDAEAKSRLVSLEHDHVKALEKLKDISGNKLKVFQCCLAEISDVKPIKGASDYAGLVKYSLFSPVKSTSKNVYVIDLKLNCSKYIFSNARNNPL